MSRQEIEVYDDGGANKYPKIVIVEPAQANCYYWSALIAAIVLGVSGAVALIISLASDAFVLNLIATNDYRVGTTKDDSYPTAPMLASAGTANLPILVSFISILAFLGYLVLTFWWRASVEQLTLGASPFLWFSFMLWHFLVWVAIAFVSGVTNVFVLTFIALSAWAWIWLWWASDLINAPFYVGAVLRENRGSSLGWQWLFWVFAAIIGIVVNVVVIIYLVETFGSSPLSPRRVFLVPPIVGIILYIPIPFLVIARWFGWWFTTPYKRDIWLLIYNAVYALIITWVFLIVFTQTP